MKKSNDDKIKFGRVVIVGRPNTGKSTLLNAMMEQKVAITSPLPQTTRKNNRVVLTDSRGKIIISDTPGMMAKVDDLVGKRINLESPKESGRADVMVMVVDISRPKSEEENKVIGIIRKSRAKKVLVYNKMDLAVDKRDFLPDYNYLEEEFDKVVTTSALKEKNVKQLISVLFELLPEVDKSTLDDDGELISLDKGFQIGMSSKEYIAELIREKAYLYLRKEVPYSVTVEVDKVFEKKGMLIVEARILTSADRYKKMIIGKNGKKIKEIGFNSRKELELMSRKKVFLQLNVEVDRHWPEREIIN
jgi:GTP-binding protein Era